MQCDYKDYMIKTELQKAIGGTFTGIYILFEILFLQYCNSMLTALPSVTTTFSFLLLSLHLCVISSLLHYVSGYVCFGVQFYDFLEIAPIVFSLLAAILAIAELSLRRGPDFKVLWNAANIFAIAVGTGLFAGFFVFYNAFYERMESFWEIVAGTCAAVAICFVTVVYRVYSTEAEAAEAIFANQLGRKKFVVCGLGVFWILLLRVLLTLDRGIEGSMQRWLNRRGDYVESVMISAGVSVCCEMFFVWFAMLCLENVRMKKAEEEEGDLDSVMVNENAN